MRFTDKERHQLFIEPTGMETDEMYVQGMSTSLPIDVQLAFLRSIPGLEEVEIMRPGYAIEYDCIDPLELKATLELKSIRGLFTIGQLNGTSGYDEAAAQGYMAGVNAVLALREQEAFIIKRSEGYIGVLIDDLITKGTNEPYRLMTARSEYRLLLRQDNADRRLTEYGYRLGLISEERYQHFLRKIRVVDEQIARMEKTFLPPSEELNRELREAETTPLEHGASLASLLRRPQLSIHFLLRFDSELASLPLEILEQIEVEIVYSGYIKQQKEQVERQQRMEDMPLGASAEYFEIHGISKEAREKLQRIQPRSIGQASRISGVSPADISVLMIWLEQQRRKGEQV
jgi:tRNA uridine 5-carboxymethylaminomethyl modification enzyme